MDEQSCRNALEQAPFGYAYHKLITDDAGKPTDYVFLEVNAAFERLTGLDRDTILGRPITEAIPGISDGDFDWIAFYGEVATGGGPRDFEQYSKPLGRYYKVHVHAPETGFFVTIFTDVTAEMTVAEAAKAFLDHTDGSDVDYRFMSDTLLTLSGGRYVSFNLFDEDGKDFTTVALSGVSEHIEKASKHLRIRFHVNLRTRSRPEVNSLTDAYDPFLDAYAGVFARLQYQISSSFCVGQSIVGLIGVPQELRHVSEAVSLVRELCPSATCDSGRIQPCGFRRIPVDLCESLIDCRFVELGVADDDLST